MKAGDRRTAENCRIARERRVAVAALHDAGKTYREIGALLGVAQQRAQQLHMIEINYRRKGGARWQAWTPEDQYREFERFREEPESA